MSVLGVDTETILAYSDQSERGCTMRNRYRLRRSMVAVATAAVIAVLSLAVRSIAEAVGEGGQAAAYQAPRAADGKPNLNGIWQALGTAHWDVEGHAARPGPVVALGALGAIPGGLGVVEGGEIPYQPWAAAKKQENFDNWLTADPAVKCYMPGVPRATYMAFPFQIVQTPEYILIAYEFASASRVVYMNRPDFEAPVDSWDGALARPLGGGDAGRRRDESGSRHLVRQRREFP